MTAGNDGGQIAGFEMFVFGILVFVLGVLVVANAWGVVDGARSTMDAATEAARAYVQAPTPGEAVAAASDAAASTLVAQGRDPSRMTLTVEGTLARCSRIVVIVGYRLRLATVPLLGGFGNGFTVHARRAELVDPFRSGLPGEARCSDG